MSKGNVSKGVKFQTTTGGESQVVVFIGLPEDPKVKDLLGALIFVCTPRQNFCYIRYKTIPKSSSDNFQIVPKTDFWNFKLVKLAYRRDRV